MEDTETTEDTAMVNAIEQLWTMLNKPSKSKYEADVKAKRVAKSAKLLVIRMTPDELPYDITWSDWAYGNLEVPMSYRTFKDNNGSPYFSKENIEKMEADRANLPEVPEAFWGAISLEEEANRRVFRNALSTDVSIGRGI
ncbi:MAG TPA: hypothetical protein EYN67_00855 [Flavobacteriales bacterium]|nr:hypothetical protein [Flavobacteriales bacterium]